MTTVRDTEQSIESFVEKLEESARILDELAEIQTQFGNLLEQRETIREEWNTLIAEVQSVLKELRQTQSQSRSQIIDLQAAQSREIEKISIRLETLNQAIQDLDNKWRANQTTLSSTYQDDLRDGLASAQDEIGGLANLLKQFQVSLETTKEAIENNKLENQEQNNISHRELESRLSSGISLSMDGSNKKVDGIMSLLEEKEQREQARFKDIETKLENLKQQVNEIEEGITQIGEKPNDLINHLKKQVATQRTLLITLIIITTLLTCLSIVNIVFWLSYK